MRPGTRCECRHDHNGTAIWGGRDGLTITGYSKPPCGGSGAGGPCATDATRLVTVRLYGDPLWMQGGNGMRNSVAVPMCEACAKYHEKGATS